MNPIMVKIHDCALWLYRLLQRQEEPNRYPTELYISNQCTNMHYTMHYGAL